MLARIYSFAAEESKAGSYSFGSAAPSSPARSMGFENAFVSKIEERVDPDDVS